MNRRLCIAAAVLGVLAACRKEMPEAVFRTVDTDFMTRSRLEEGTVETRKTGITLAAYGDGHLAASRHYTTGLEAMVLDLRPGMNYTVYALVNMGDLSEALPLNESDLSTVTYRIPSYTEGAESLSGRGLPMAGRLTYTGDSGTIPVERLLAKVTVRLSCEWTGAALRSVKVCNLNRVLRPFGLSAAEQTWEEQEFQAGDGSSGGTFTFYVPENRQDPVEGITSSRDKSPDRNEEILSRSSRLTYLETVAEGTGLYAGTMTYRSYLGKDALTDFDIQRNARYVWDIRYLADGLQESSWKRESDLTDTRFLYWEEHPGVRTVHVRLKAGAYGTRAGDPWRPEDFVMGDATGSYRIQGTPIYGENLLEHLGYSVDPERFTLDRCYRDAIWFQVGAGGLPPGDYETRFYFLDRPDLSLSAWLHVRDEQDLQIDDEWDDEGETILP